MKKVILASVLTAVGVLAQGTTGNAPAAGSKANPPAATAPSTSSTPAPKTTVKKHRKNKKDVNSNSTTPAVKPAAPNGQAAPAAK